LNRNVDHEEAETINEVIDVEDGTTNVMGTRSLQGRFFVFAVDTFEGDVAVPRSQELAFVGAGWQDEDGK